MKTARILGISMALVILGAMAAVLPASAQCYPDPPVGTKGGGTGGYCLIPGQGSAQAMSATDGAMSRFQFVVTASKMWATTYIAARTWSGSPSALSTRRMDVFDRNGVTTGSR